MAFLRRSSDLIKKSIYSPDAYRAVRGQTFGRAVGYVAMAAVFPTVAFMLLAIVGIFSFVPFSVSDEVAHLYPDNLEITITEGIVQTNVPEPYAIPMPTKWQRIDSAEGATTPTPENFLVIDTRDNLTADEIQAYDSMFILGRSRIYARESDHKLETFDMTDPSFTTTITKTKALEFVHDMMPYVYAFGVLMFIVVIGFIFAFLFATYLLYAVGGALVVMAIGWIVHNTHSFKESTVVAAYALIPVGIIQMITDTLSLNAFGLGLALFFVVVFTNLRNQLTSPTAMEPSDL